MKKITISIFAFLTSVLSLNAQSILDFSQDPLSLYMLKVLHHDLYTEADSIVSSLDSGTQFTARDYMIVDYFSNGLIDTATFYDANGTAEFAYKGIRTASQTDVIGYDISSGSSIEDRTTFYHDASANDRDTLIEFSEFDGTSFNVFTYLRFGYDTLSKVESIELHAFDGTSGFFQLGTFEFHYKSSGDIDSVVLVSAIGVPVDLLRISYIYNSNSQLSRLDIKEDTSFTGVYNTTAYEIPKYAAGKIYEFQQMLYDDSTNAFEVQTVVRFLNRTSGIGLKENVSANISVYPNPASEVLKIDGLIKNTAYTIVDVSGKLVKKGEAVKGEAITINDLKTGIYILQLETDEPVSLRFEKL